MLRTWHKIFNCRDTQARAGTALMTLDQKVAIQMSFLDLVYFIFHQVYGGNGMELCCLGRLFGIRRTGLSQAVELQRTVEQSIGMLINTLESGLLIHVPMISPTFVRKKYE